MTIPTVGRTFLAGTLAASSPPPATAVAPAPTPYQADRFQAQSLPEPPGHTTGTPQKLFWDRISPREFAVSALIHVGGGAVAAAGIGAGIAWMAGGAIGSAALIGAGVGALLGWAFLAAVLAIAG